MESIHSLVEQYIAGVHDRSFLTAAEVVASQPLIQARGPVDTALSRLAKDGLILRIRKGIYWKANETRFGITPPSREEVALYLGGPGSGPADIGAASWLGLTTQVPAMLTVAVPTRAPAAWRSVHFATRSLGRRDRNLSQAEVAVLEVLRAGLAVTESTWSAVSDAIVRLIDEGQFRPAVVAAQVADEHHLATRERWATLTSTTPNLAVALTA